MKIRKYKSFLFVFILIIGIIYNYMLFTGRVSFVPASGSKEKSRSEDGMVLIPAGKFIMGTGSSGDPPVSEEFKTLLSPFENEKQAREVFVEAFYPE